MVGRGAEAGGTGVWLARVPERLPLSVGFGPRAWILAGCTESGITIRRGGDGPKSGLTNGGLMPTVAGLRHRGEDGKERDGR